MLHGFDFREIVRNFQQSRRQMTGPIARTSNDPVN